ncbi:MAG: T9SS type A sorting domain-containing protein, partial [Ignavibacteriaceae bacterium]|nr:T9SS type A sorting domain-containing protein [Ignavibacteriaceae bacterium]
RVAAISPHPESELHLQFIIRKTIDWLARNDALMVLTSPFQNEEWIVGKTKKIGWVTDGGLSTARIDYSTDNGANWTMITASSSSPYTWVVPDAPSSVCKIKITSLTESSFGDTISFKIIPEPPSIYSVIGGNWSEPSTWVGGVVPDSTDNVIIDSSHTVIVDSEAKCSNLTFDDASSRLGLSANLRIYGNVNLFDNSTNPFYSGATLWSEGAKMIFTGAEETQQINNLGTTSSSPFPIRFDELVVDKNSGKFATSIGSNVKLGIGTSLEIINGTFELASSDDIEGRNTSGAATTPTITVRSNGIFNMIGSSSVIRRGNFIGDETGKLGKLIVYGTAYLVSGTTSGKLNFTGIDIENGGLVDIPLGRGTVSSAMNCGVITIKSGGKLKNNLNTAFWYNNPTVPPSIVINNGGEYEASSSATTLPQGGVTQNSGSTIRYSFGGDITMPVGISSYKTLILSNSGNKSLGVTTTIEEYLQLSGTATLNKGAYNLIYNADAVLRYGASGQTSAQTTTDNEWPASDGPLNVQVYNTGGVTLHDDRTLSGTLTLTVGSLDNNGSADDKKLTFGNDATITRARGSLTVEPTFGSNINLRYTSSLENVTTGYEMPAAPTVLKDLNISSSQGITLGGDVTVNGTFTLGGGGVLLNGHSITYGTVVDAGGALSESQNLNAPLSVNIGNLGVLISSGSNLGSTTVKRGFASQTGAGNAGIKRWYDISPANNTGLNATLVFQYNEGDELNGIPEANLRLFKSTNGGTTWTYAGGTVDAGANTVTLTGIDGFSRWTLASENAPLPVELTSFTANVKGNGVELRWKTESEVNSYLFEVQKSVQNSEWEKAGEVAASGNSNSPREYTFTDDNVMTGKYRYRLRIVDNDGSAKYSNTVEVNTGMPVRFNLSQNYPNPFNPTTTISFTLAQDGMTELKVFNIIGQEVASLFKEEGKAGQIYRISFNASDLPSGIYFAKLLQGNSQMMKKMILIK